VDQVHLLEKRNLGLVVPGSDAGGPLEEEVFKEMCDAGDSLPLVHTSDAVLDHEGDGGSSGPGKNEKTEPILQRMLVKLREVKRRLLGARRWGEEKKKEE